MNTWFAQAPANIALIKYMGKIDGSLNVPTNASLSYTLPDLLSFVELESTSEPQDRWEILQMLGADAFSLSASGAERFLKHLQLMKKQFNYDGHFIVRSCNNFPMATGLASSASSFAALTIAANRALSSLTQQPELSVTQLADLSRQGSGSSCRSFLGPFTMWNEKGVSAVSDLAYPQLLHQAVIVSHDKKEVSSSEAHQRVKTSPLFAERLEQCAQRLPTLLIALQQGNWRRCYELVRNEFLEMHELFHTANPSFSYMTEESRAILAEVEQDWQTNNDGPLVTMDAGPNVHLLFREDQQALAQRYKEQWVGRYDVL